MFGVKNENPIRIFDLSIEDDADKHPHFYRGEMIESGDHAIPTWPRRAFSRSIVTSALSRERIQLGLVVAAGLAVGLLVIVATYYVHNFKLIIGLVGGLAFVLLTMQWPELGILSYVALLSGLINLRSLPGLRLGVASFFIQDAILLLLLGLVFLRATTRPGFKLFASPLTVPLLLFYGAFILAILNAIFVYGVNKNEVLRSTRALAEWIIFIPTLQLVRDEQSLRRFLPGLLVFTGILLIGVLFPNRFGPILAVEEFTMGTGAQTYSGFTRLFYDGDMILYAMIPVTVASLAMIKKRNQIWRIGLLGLLIFWVVKTFYREYWLTLSVTCVLLLWLLSSEERVRLLKRMAPALAAGVLLLIIMLISQPAQVQRILDPVIHRAESLTRDPIKTEGSLQWRVIESNYALIQIGRHPLFGLGLGSAYRPPMESEDGTTTYGWASKYVENGYLYIAVMMGLVGLVPFLLLCAVYLLRVFRHQYEIRDDGLRAVYLGFGVAFLGMMACNFVSPTFFFGPKLVYFPVAMAVSEVILRLEREKKAGR